MTSLDKRVLTCWRARTRAVLFTIEIVISGNMNERNAAQRTSLGVLAGTYLQNPATNQFMIGLDPVEYVF